MKRGTLRRVNLNFVGKKVPIPELLAGNQPVDLKLTTEMERPRVVHMHLYSEEKSLRFSQLTREATSHLDETLLALLNLAQGSCHGDC